MLGKKALIHVIGLLWPIVTSAQLAPTDLQHTCRTLAALTAEATRSNATEDVILYKRAADRIRARLGGGCELLYFTNVVRGNSAVLQTAGIFLTIDASKPMKGWTHDEIDRFSEIAVNTPPSSLMKRLQYTDPVFNWNFEQTQRDLEALKKYHPDLFKLPKSEELKPQSAKP